MSNYDIIGFFNAFDSGSWLAASSESIVQMLNWITSQYSEAPALVLGVGLALALPALAVISALLRLLIRATTPSSPEHVSDDKTVRTIPISAWNQSASFEMTDNSHYPISQPIVRIGREIDNDLCLSDPTIHRYHAVLERSPDAEYMISYIGDPDRDGLFINGRAAQRQRLSGGEVLEIGAIKLRFTLSPA